jgi:hypothetical protein
MNVHGRAFIERNAGMALVTGFAFFGLVFAIDCFGKDSCTSCFAYATGPAKQKSMRQLIVPDRIFQGSCNMRLPNNGIKSLRPVFSC